MFDVKSKVESSLNKLRTPTSASETPGYDSDHNSTQLIFPNDLGTNFKDFNGHCVLFEPNVIKGHKSAYTTKYSAPSRQIDGAYGREVAMQNAGINGGSIRGADSPEEGIYRKTNERIVLPMPPSLTTTYMANWQNTELGSIGTMGDLKDSVVDMHFGVAGEQVWDSLKRTLAGATQSLSGLGLKDYAELSSGANLNPYVEVLFRGMNNRSIPFSFVLTPRNLEEAKIIRSIIHRFKYHMVPEFKYESGNNSFILHPSTFDISFMDLNKGTANPWVHRVSTCALTNFTVNGTPGGEYSISQMGSLTSITIELFFTEMTLLTKSNFPSPSESY